MAASKQSVLLLSPLHILSTPQTLFSLGLSLFWCLVVISLYHLDILSTQNGCWQQKGAERTLGGLASVTGLLLAFRSNSATSRWDGASRCWASIQAAERSLMRLLSVSLWHDVQAGREEGDDDEEKETTQLEGHVDDFLRLFPSFALAVLVHLEASAPGGSRQRSSSRSSSKLLWSPSTSDPEDVKASKAALRSVLPTFFLRSLDFSTSPSSSRLSRLPSSSSSVASRHSHTKARGLSSEAERELNLSQNIDGPLDLLRRSAPHVDPLTGSIVPRNLPVDILREMQTGLVRFHQGVTATSSRQRSKSQSRREVKLSGPVFAHSVGLLNTLSSQLTELERLRDTPIPALLSSHLRLLLNLQLALTPLALARAYVPLLYLPLPCLILAVGTCGLHAVSEGLSMPFGRAREKLPMRRLCADIVGDWRETVARVRELGRRETEYGEEAEKHEKQGENEPNGSGGAGDRDHTGIGNEKADEAKASPEVPAWTSSTEMAIPQQDDPPLRKRRSRWLRWGGVRSRSSPTNGSAAGSGGDATRPSPRAFANHDENDDDEDVDLHGHSQAYAAGDEADAEALAAADRVAASYGQEPD